LKAKSSRESESGFHGIEDYASADEVELREGFVLNTWISTFPSGVYNIAANLRAVMIVMKSVEIGIKIHSASKGGSKA
jgi:hypothetical protein